MMKLHIRLLYLLFGLILIIVPYVATVSDCDKPIREGFASTYSFRFSSDSEWIGEPSFAPAFTISQARDPGFIERMYRESLENPVEPYFIQVFQDHVDVNHPRQKTKVTIPSNLIININWIGNKSNQIIEPTRSSG